MNPNNDPNKQQQPSDGLESPSVQQEKSITEHKQSNGNSHGTGKVKQWVKAGWQEFRSIPLKDRLMIEITLYLLLAALGAAYIYFRQSGTMDETLIEIRASGQQTERLIALNTGSLLVAKDALEESRKNAADTLTEMQKQSGASQQAAASMEGQLGEFQNARQPWVGLENNTVDIGDGPTLGNNILASSGGGAQPARL